LETAESAASSERFERERRVRVKIAILTGGGDAPGMNAAVRAVARSAFSLG
jgi:hypothetical protein